MSLGEAGAEGPAGGAASKTSKALVLIVDDIAENRLVLGICCEQFGLRYEAVASGQEAVECARSGRFDLILMDILMPGMDGVAATVAIRTLPGPAGAVPIIAVTTAADRIDVLHYRACGVTDVVPKPIDVARLMGSVSTALARSRRLRRGHRQDRAQFSA
ncbi:MAG TPA: response regulator [Caulobacteraceae bacterium]|jgi:CheY-like chemotaxis protein|nr:response regulator [Caulobacteraceae bacterium]